MEKKELVDRLVKLREDAGMSAADVYKKCRLAPNTILKLEDGTSNFSLDILFKYLSSIQVNIKLVSKDGDIQKDIVIKQPGRLKSIVHDMLFLQRTNVNNIISKTDLAPFSMKQIADGELNGKASNFLVFVDLAGYDIDFQVNEIMRERVNKARKAEEEKYKSMTEEEIDAEMKRIGEMMKAARKKSGKSMKYIARDLDLYSSVVYSMEQRVPSLDWLMKYLDSINGRFFAIKGNESVHITGRDDMAKLIKTCRGKMKKKQLADLAMTSIHTITAVESSSTKSLIKTLVPILNVFGYKIVIE